MKLTPLDMRHQEFGAAISGYSKREVRDFLERVADQAEDTERELRAYAERVAALEARVAELREGEETLKRAVVSAERIAGELRQSAEREAELTLREAEAAKERLMRDALAKVRDVRSELERARGERNLFLGQFRAMLEGYLASVERAEEAPKV